MRLRELLRKLIPRKRGRLRPTVPTAALPLVVAACAFTVIGLGLCFQSNRFENTPSYGNLLVVAPALVWGVIHLVIAGVMFASIRWRTVRRFAVVGHTMSIALVSTWLLAFVIRYLTDDGTTIVNVVNWSVLLFLVIRSAIELDQWTEPPAPADPRTLL